MARAPTFRHNKRMSSRSLAVGLAGLALGTIWGAAALADNSDEATVIVRASGKSGEITRVRRSDRNGVDRSLPPELDGGVIPRSALAAETARGIGRFLQQVRVEPVLSHRQFVGWRLVTLFPKRDDVRVQGLQVGDVVLRLNGQSIERPEEFKAVWDSLADARQLIVELERGGEATRVRYAID